MSQPNETYLVNGVEYTMSELSAISHMHRDTILNRLKKGMTIEEAIALPAGRLPYLNSEDIGKQVPIVFSQPLPSVFTKMQPVLGKLYMATIHGRQNTSNNLCKVFYIIQLDNGKPLITYPGEFHVAGTPTEIA